MLIILTLLSLVGCAAPTPLSDNLNRVGYKAVKIVERELPLKCEGIGRMVQDGKIATADLTFDYSIPMSIESGRCVILQCINTALYSFQNDQAIQQYLQVTPFGISQLVIYLYSDLYAFAPPPSNMLSGLAFYKGIIRYRQYNPTTKQLETIYEETYEEALQKCMF